MTNEPLHRRLRCLLLACALPLGACESTIDVDLASGGIAEDADGLILAIDGVDLLEESGSKFEVDADTDDDIDLLDYDDGDSLQLVGGEQVDQTRYTGLRLRFADSGSVLYTDDGGEHPIDVESAPAFADIDVDLEEGDSASLLVLIEPRFSLWPSTTSGRYALDPVLRVVDAEHSGSIAGSVDEDLVRSDTCRQGRGLGEGVAVYAFDGANVTPMDYVDGYGGSPVSSATVVENDDGNFYYDFPFLAAGSYTLAVTCNADSEAPAQDDGLAFFAAESVTLDESEAATVNLSE